MTQILVIISFVLVHAGAATPASLMIPTSPQASIAGVVLSLGGVWLVAHAFVLRCMRRLDATGSHDAAMASERAVLVSRLAGVGIFGVACTFGGWVAAVRASVGNLLVVDELAAVLPMLLFLAAGWISGFEVERRIRESIIFRRLHEGQPLHQPPTRMSWVWSRVRIEMLTAAMPLALVFAWTEWLEGQRARWAWLSAGDGAAEAALQLVGVVAVFLAAPIMLRRVWDAIDLGPGELRSRIEAMLTQHRVKVRGPLVWRTGGASLNGAILGAVYPARYLLLTDALLEHLRWRHVEAVIAHEIGHVRRRHLPWLALTMVAVISATSMIVAVPAAAVPNDAMGGVAGQFSGTLLVLGVAIVTFGWVSRRFEWQADAFAVRHLSEHPEAADAVVASPVRDEVVSPQAAHVMAEALGQVAELNGMSTRRYSFRHGSIHDRQRRVAALIGQRLDALPIDRHVRWIKRSVLALLVLTITLGVMLERTGL
jgi:Zn-dependent protease with chaperone function